MRLQMQVGFNCIRSRVAKDGARTLDLPAAGRDQSGQSRQRGRCAYRRIEIDKAGKIVIITTSATEAPGEMTEANEWDRV